MQKKVITTPANLWYRNLHYFYGNKETGYWWYWNTNKREGITLSVQQIIDDSQKKQPQFIWIRTEDSGDFYWPHIQRQGEELPQPLMYGDDDSIGLNEQENPVDPAIRT